MTSSLVARLLLIGIAPSFLDSNSPELTIVRPRNTNPLLSKLHIHRSISMNKGKNWSNLQPTDLLNPDSAIDAINLGNKTILLAYNRVVTYSKSRNILSLAISFNEGVNWHPIGIKDSIFPKGDMEYSKLTSQEYSYPAIIMDIYSKEIHVAYTFNRINFKHKVFKLLQN